MDARHLEINDVVRTIDSCSIKLRIQITKKSANAETLTGTILSSNNSNYIVGKITDARAAVFEKVGKVDENTFRYKRGDLIMYEQDDVCIAIITEVYMETDSLGAQLVDMTMIKIDYAPELLARHHKRVTTHHWEKVQGKVQILV